MLLSKSLCLFSLQSRKTWRNLNWNNACRYVLKRLIAFTTHGRTMRDAVERAKKEQELLTSAKKHHESQVTQIKGLINWLRRSAPIDDNKIKGRDYEFTLSKKKAMTVLISSDIQDWTEEEQQKYCIMETVTTTKHTVVTSMDGTVLEEDTKPTTKTETIPNLNAILNAYQEGQRIPTGVKIQQDYNIRRARILVKRSVELSPSAYPSEFLPEPEAAN
jgi:hypothetical protein